MQLETLAAGMQVHGVVPGAPVKIIATLWHGPDAVELTYKSDDGRLDERILYRTDESTLTEANAEGRPFNSPASDFKLAAECQRITLAGRFDPMLAVATSDVQPLPHQIKAVYQELLPRTPLRFLLADDPGAGKTVMAGLYIKELMLREDVHRCLIVAPGGLVEQWQDELLFKFGQRFTILGNELIDSGVDSVFQNHPLLIARMDQLSRNEELLDHLGQSQWDLVVVDEAHRMGAHYFGQKLHKTKRFQLGERLGNIARHLLLMTATPHSGKEEDFQLFLTLLDRDRFEGKYRKTVHSVDTDGLMRRLVKEELLTFDGKPLFPDRVAETVPYELTEREQDLYEQVTDYVKHGMNQAENLDGKRRATVGFALTVLQRRLASSPEAIYRSLLRRSDRLKRHRQALIDGTPVVDETGTVEIPDDTDEFLAEEVEQLEERLVDAATASRSVEDFTRELAELDLLIEAARVVRESGNDRKWVELRTILEDHSLVAPGTDHRRKLIIFTEHRDTLDYLQARIQTLWGRPEAVVAIHGGVRRPERRRITEEFTKNPQCQVLLATDAAGEGLNLQVAHLMVNYDLPWNPNRIEQRFGRIHRIGQTEECRLWNLVASNTREGDVFQTLLDKLEVMRATYGGKVFDVLGEALAETPLRDLLIEAIRHGELPEVRQRMQETIDASVSEGLKDLLDERALAHDSLRESDLETLRRQMDEARARRLQPHYIEAAFREAFQRLGGRMVRREKGRFEISNVPATIRHAAQAPVATRYERVCFDLEYVDVPEGVRGDLLAPGHPLHDAVMHLAIERWSAALHRGTVLISPTVESPCLLVGVAEDVVDATGSRPIASRFGYAFVQDDGSVSPAGPAPYLDCVAAPDTQAIKAFRNLPWLQTAESAAMSWIIAHQLPEFLAEVQAQRLRGLSRERDQVKRRLQAEINRLASESMVAASLEQQGQKPRESSESLDRKMSELDARLERRLRHLDRQEKMSTLPPRVVTAALVLPLALLDDEQRDADARLHAVETKEVERRGVDLVLARERELGRAPVEQAFTNPGFDILSTSDNGSTLRIEVKARLDGKPDFFVTRNEVLTGKNAAPNYRLAMVRVDPRGPEHDRVTYQQDPFADVNFGELDAMGVTLDWAKTWAKAREPF